MEISNEVILGCIDADRRSQFKLYELCYPFMMSIALRYRKGSDNAASSVNTAFLKILNNLATFDNNQSLKAWIRRILINTMIDEFRKTKRLDSLKANVDFEKEIAINGIHVDYNTAESNLNVETLTQYIHELSPITANVFNLFVMDGFAHKDIGEMLQISEAASKWHLFTARKQLQERVLSAQKTNHQLIASRFKVKEA